MRLGEFGLNAKNIFKKFRKDAYQPNVQFLKTTSKKILDKLSYNLDFAFGQCNTVQVLGDFNLNFFTTKVRKTNWKAS